MFKYAIKLITLTLGFCIPLVFAQPKGYIKTDLTKKISLDTKTQSCFLYTHKDLTQKVEEVNLIIHLHGETEYFFNSFEGNKHTIVVLLNLGKYSGSYDKKYFYDKTKFPALTKKIGEQVRELSKNDDIKLKSITLSSFSAGYAGIRAILNDEPSYDRIKAVILADGMYADNPPDSVKKQMSPFLKLAKDAVAGKKVFIISHSDVVTTEYVTAKPATDYILEKLGLKRTSVKGKDAIGVKESEVSKGLFKVHGYKNDDQNGHYNHLKGIGKFIKDSIALIKLEEK